MKKKKVFQQKYFCISAFSLILFLTIWWLCTDVLDLVPKIALPGPIAVINTFFIKLYDPRPDGATLVEHMTSSLKVAMSGYLIGVIVGMPLGILMAWYKKVDMFVRPVFDLIKPIPGVAWVPLTIVFFGIGSLSKAMVIFMSVFVSCVVNAYSGINQTKNVHVWVAKTFGASHLKTLFKVAIPSALPMMFVGLRVSLAAAWAAIVAAELIASTRGLGFMIQQCRGIFRPDVIITGMIAIGIIGSILTSAIGLLEKHFLKGRKAIND